MELNEQRVIELSERALAFPLNASVERAEPWVADRVAEAHRPFVVNGIDSTPPAVLDQHEQAARTQWDGDRAAEGAVLETELAGVAAVLGDRIDAAKVVTPYLEPLTSPQMRQTEELIALLMEDKLRERFGRLTRREALDIYTTASEETQAGRRMIAFLETHRETVGFVDNPDDDAVAIHQFKAAIEARQLARVPKQLLDWRDRIQRAQRYAGFTEVLRHLRSGRGIATRPKPATLRLA
jgi:hypothetical protein